MFFHANKDYTAKIEIVGGCERYFIKFYGQVTAPEIEVTSEYFMLYVKEFNRPMERQKNEQRRHIEDGELDGFHRMEQLSVFHMEDVERKCVIKVDLDAVLKKCTPTQRRRFDLHYSRGYSLTEIARLERCDESSVRESVRAVKEKLKNYLNPPNPANF